MNDTLFVKFRKIENLSHLWMIITQKIHGTNAQIYIYKKEDGSLDLLTGCRSRWITPENDNFGFSKYVYENKQSFIELLGEGRHFGEWAGPGINSGEGLKEKRLYLFNTEFIGKCLPERCGVVPKLYDGPYIANKLDEVFESLKQNGSYIVPGYKNTEGIVIQLGGLFFKKVFLPEETKWKSSDKISRNPKSFKIDVSYLLQPIRLDKLLSRDENLIRNYPKTLSGICKLYTNDLEQENQISGNEDEKKLIYRNLGKELYPFVKTQIHQTLKDYSI
jgi:RNA ligase